MLKTLVFFLAFVMIGFVLYGLGQPETVSPQPPALTRSVPSQNQPTGPVNLPTSGSPATPPTLSSIQAVLERQSQRQRRFPLFPSNQMEFYQGWYRWVLGASDVIVQVFILDDPQELMEGFTNPLALCTQRSYRGATFQIQNQTQLILAYEIETGLNQWIVFTFPDQDLPVCGFMDEFIQLYQFFLRSLPQTPQPQFPAVIGTMPR